MHDNVRAEGDEMEMRIDEKDYRHYHEKNMKYEI